MPAADWCVNLLEEGKNEGVWGLIVPRAGWVAAGGFPTRTNWNKTLPCIPSEQDRLRKIKRKSLFFYYSSLLKGVLNP